MSLPNFMCLGAAKSGTTTLYDILRQHSDIYIPSFKEPHFFDIPQNFENGLQWYEKTYFNKADRKIIADFTPTYLFDLEAPKRIFESLGADLKFLVIIRNPVDRAYSHYLHSKRDHHEIESFEKSLELEFDRLKKYKGQADYLSYLRHSYIGQGQYYQMLNRFFEFFPRENFLILNFEQEFIAQREMIIQKIFNFLGLKKENINFDLSSNKASKAKSIWLKKIMKKTGWWRVLLKKMIPSLKVRQIIKNKIQSKNITLFTPPKINQEDRQNIFNSYFRHDVNNLEKLLNRKMHWD